MYHGTLVFATGNANKVKEVQALVGDDIVIKSLHDLGYFEELSETHDTLEGNALEKAMFIFEKFGENCFSEDTGLEVDALNGEPGVYSARYAGPEKGAEDNMTLLLEKLKGQTNRKARFRTVISLIIDAKEFRFEGIVEGQILEVRKGNAGFGYDPIFQPTGYDRSFAEMSLAEKAPISHRGKAVSQLLEFLKFF
jgi:XTP/dITP diphosphohydrolase